ncbi:MAG: CAP domain-containing protein [Alphaproteobacteria bacterium]|nr:CAP domain-containing protein [Alphaproteobacteria bacterium]
MIRQARPIFALLALLVLAACTDNGLAPGLTARLDSPGAEMDRSVAIGLINDLRAARGAEPVRLDPALNVEASKAAALYARSGSISAGRRALGPIRVRLATKGHAEEKVSAGYATFSDTFSGWRGNPGDTQALTVSWATRAGLGVHYDASSEFGTYWVLVLAAEEQNAEGAGQAG